MEADNAKIFELLGKDQFAKNSNMRLIEAGLGSAIAEMEIDQRHLNGLGSVQGGVLFTLADFVCAAASNSQGKVAVSLDASISFVKAISKGKLTAVASEIYLRRTVAAYKVEIRNEENDLIAVFQSTSYRKEPKQ
ncbi:MAG: PaaI family thioesterase [Paludibacteraceae bacterium]|nr:PaaI family thioesterase [Prevotellaceae bacterium]